LKNNKVVDGVERMNHAHERIVLSAYVRLLVETETRWPED